MIHHFNNNQNLRIHFSKKKKKKCKNDVVD